MTTAVPRAALHAAGKNHALSKIERKLFWREKQAVQVMHFSNSKQKKG